MPIICPNCPRAVSVGGTAANDNAPDHGVLHAASDWELRRPAHIQRIAVALRSRLQRPGITRRDIPDWITNTIVGFDGPVLWPDGRPFVLTDALYRKAFYAHKYPYFTRREMAGRYLPNPYHPPTGSVVVATRLGKRRLPVVTERVPEKYASFPQYASGYWSYVKGYRP